MIHINVYGPIFISTAPNPSGIPGKEKPFDRFSPDVSRGLISLNDCCSLMFAREMKAGLSVVCDPFSINEVTLLMEANMSILDKVGERAVNVVIRNAIVNSAYLPVTIGILI
jgi:hypothetical protein